jgi:hypothetical protein
MVLCTTCCPSTLSCDFAVDADADALQFAPDTKSVTFTQAIFN